MKSKTIYLLLFLTVIPFINYAQENYAPWVQLRQNISEDTRLTFNEMKMNTPAKNIVGIPAYTGAQIIETSQYTGSVDDSRNPALPTVTLISDDPVGKVIGVYKDIIEDFPDWHLDIKLQIFYKGDLQESLDGYSPYIRITPILTREPDLIYVSPYALDSAKTRIVVCYNPQSVKDD